MQKIVIGPSRRRLVMLLVASLCFVVGGVMVLVTGADRLVGVVCIVFFGAGAIAAAMQLRDGRPRLVIDDSGIFDRTLKVGVIAWDDIENAWVRKLRNQPFLCLELRDTAKYLNELTPMLRRMVELNEKLGFTPLALNLGGTGTDPDQIHALVLRELAARRGAPRA